MIHIKDQYLQFEQTNGTFLVIYKDCSQKMFEILTSSDSVTFLIMTEADEIGIPDRFKYFKKLVEIGVNNFDLKGLEHLPKKIKIYARHRRSWWHGTVYPIILFISLLLLFLSFLFF